LKYLHITLKQGSILVSTNIRLYLQNGCLLQKRRIFGSARIEIKFHQSKYFSICLPKCRQDLVFIKIFRCIADLSKFYFSIVANISDFAF